MRQRLVTVLDGNLLDIQHHVLVTVYEAEYAVVLYLRQYVGVRGKEMLVNLYGIVEVVYVVLEHILLHVTIKLGFCRQYIGLGQRYSKNDELVATVRLLVGVRHQCAKRLVVLLYDNVYLLCLRIRVFATVANVSVTVLRMYHRVERSVRVEEVTLVVLPVDVYRERTAKALSAAHVYLHFLGDGCTGVQVERQLR